MFVRASSPSVHISVFGAPSIATPLGAISSAKPFVFAAALYLGLNRGRAIRREELATLLWPDASEAKQSERMRWLVRQLKLAGFDVVSGASELLAYLEPVAAPALVDAAALSSRRAVPA